MMTLSLNPGNIRKCGSRRQGIMQIKVTAMGEKSKGICLLLMSKTII